MSKFTDALNSPLPSKLNMEETVATESEAIEDIAEEETVDGLDNDAPVAEENGCANGKACEDADDDDGQRVLRGVYAHRRRQNAPKRDPPDLTLDIRVRQDDPRLVTHKFALRNTVGQSTAHHQNRDQNGHDGHKHAHADIGKRRVLLFRLSTHSLIPPYVA